jgi:two-component system chemotaxis response regulator CheB
LGKTCVLVVDDSALVRKLLSRIIDDQNDMYCVGTAGDPFIAREMIRELNPDVLTLDVEMPRMDGIEFLTRLMRLRPMPVVMISTLTERGAEVTMQALELGAVDFVAKPRIGLVDGINVLAKQIVEKIRVAAYAKITRVAHSCKLPKPDLLGNVSTEHVICIGASTGGTEAIREILTHLPGDSPAIVIAQHMPAGFTTSFARRLNLLCDMTIKEAMHGEQICAGYAYIAPGGQQFRLERSGASYVAVVENGDLVNRHKPSVEVLFNSAAQVAGRNAFGIMLTGMGNDGARAMLEMKNAGSYNYVQDEASCIVFGMPREAIAHGAANEILPLKSIAPALLARLRGESDHYQGCPPISTREPDGTE